jgi:hypothetical protein
LQLGVDERQTSLKADGIIHGVPPGLRTLLLGVVRSCFAQFKTPLPVARQTATTLTADDFTPIGPAISTAPWRFDGG